MVKYMNNPKTSFNVVTKGPVASAGSIFHLSSSNGISVPNIAAKNMTVNKDKLTTNPRAGFPKT